MELAIKQAEQDVEIKELKKQLLQEQIKKLKEDH